jgi:hypothetical protein
MQKISIVLIFQQHTTDCERKMKRSWDFFHSLVQCSPLKAFQAVTLDYLFFYFISIFGNTAPSKRDFFMAVYL